LFGNYDKSERHDERQQEAQEQGLTDRSAELSVVQD
jgi:hypothetical protein